MNCSDVSVYNIMTCSYYFIIAIFGLTCGKTFVYDNYIMMIACGSVAIYKQLYGGNIFDLILFITLHNIHLKFWSEVVRRWFRPKYYIPLVIHSLISGIYLCVGVIYQSVLLYLNITLLVSLQSIGIMCCLFIFPRGSIHYYITRKIILSVNICFTMTIIGLCINRWCHLMPSQLMFLQFFIAQPVLNIYLTYGMFHIIQIITLLKGINCGRSVVFRGSQITLALWI